MEVKLVDWSPDVRSGRRTNCGYRYMMPSYVDLDEKHDPANSYRVVLDALLENSSAHGLPTFYQARGSLFTSTFSQSRLSQSSVL